MDTRFPTAVRDQVEIQKKTADANPFYEGTKAFYDTFAGMVPCVVIEVKEKVYGFFTSPRDSIVIKLTADRGAYKKGEILTVSAFCCPPRNMIHKMKYSSRIRTYYSYLPKTPT